MERNKMNSEEKYTQKISVFEKAAIPNVLIPA